MKIYFFNLGLISILVLLFCLSIYPIFPQLIVPFNLAIFPPIAFYLISRKNTKDILKKQNSIEEKKKFNTLVTLFSITMHITTIVQMNVKNYEMGQFQMQSFKDYFYANLSILDLEMLSEEMNYSAFFDIINHLVAILSKKSAPEYFDNNMTLLQSMLLSVLIANPSFISPFIAHFPETEERILNGIKNTEILKRKREKNQ